jgi:methylated-DNA-[protein]-cysteine S-methyltransferase
VTVALATVATPAGPFAVLAGGDGVLASGWTADAGALARLAGTGERVERRRGLGALTDAVEAYLEGELAAIDAVPVAQRSRPFRAAVWDALRATPPGRPVTYRELARRCGRPGAARAAGAACAANASALFVPCHRAVRGDGGLGGFLWGLEVKRWLLDHEAAAARRSVRNSSSA